MNKKGDVERYILWFIVLAIIMILVLVLVYTGAWKTVQEYIAQRATFIYE